MKRSPPPPVLACARVLSYAFVEDLTFQCMGMLFSGDQPVGPVPRLAICRNLGMDFGPMLLHCDDEWNVVFCGGGDTIEQCRQSAERCYPGVTLRWFDTNTTLEQALEYFDNETGGLKCSFCGKRPFDVEGWVTKNNTTICRGCVEEIYQQLQAAQ